MRDNIKGARVAKGLTQTEVAKLMNQSKNTYNLKENGKRKFDEDEIKLLLSILEKKFEELF